MVCPLVCQAGQAAGIIGGVVGSEGEGQAVQWTLGSFKSEAKWLNQMEQRGWTNELITDAIQNGESVTAVNNINPSNPALRYVSPSTGQSVVVDTITNEVLHVGGPGFRY